jgi:hypothetical protein
MLAGATSQHAECSSRISNAAADFRWTRVVADSLSKTADHPAWHCDSDDVNGCMKLPNWSYAFESYYNAIDDFTSAYWRTVDASLRRSTSGYWRQVEDRANPRRDCDDVTDCGWWLDFPRMIFNATRSRRVQSLPMQEQKINVSYRYGKSDTKNDALDFWTFLGVFNIDLAADWSSVTQQRYY